MSIKKFVATSGASLAYQLFSPKHINTNALPLLMVGGWSAVMSDWHGFDQRLSQEGNRTVLIFDNRGIGQSSIPPGPYTTEQMAKEAYELANSILLPISNNRGYHILGISMGGMIVQTLLSLQDIDTSNIKSAIIGCSSPIGKYSVAPKPENIMKMTQFDETATPAEKSFQTLSVWFV